MHTKLVPLIMICLVATGAASLTACNEVNMNRTCTDIAVVSVTVTVVDAAGNPITDAMVQYSVDGGPTESCTSIGSDHLYSCGYEQAGSFVITVTRDTATAMATVDVPEGDCHPESQTITVTLG